MLQIDSPVSPSDKGLTLFLKGISDIIQQQHRDRLFAVTKESVVDVAKQLVSCVI